MPAAAGRAWLEAFGSALLDRSLLVYLFAVAASRLWMLLNTDVAELLRRVH